MDTELLEHVGLVAGILLSTIGIYWKGIRPLCKWTYEKYVTYKEFWASLATAANLVNYELSPNDNGSMKDAMQEIRESVRLQGWTQREMLDVDKNDAVFITDELGHCKHVNQAYEVLVGRDKNELLGEGWLVVVPLAERQQTSDEWSLAREQNRTFEVRMYFAHSDGTRFKIKCRARPMLDTRGNFAGFFGVVTPESETVEEAA